MLKIKQQKAIVCVWGSFQMKSCILWILIGSFSPWLVSWCELSIEWTAAVKMAPAKSQGIHRKLRCFRLQHKPFGPSFTLRKAWLFVSEMSINMERCQALWVNLIWVEKRHFAGRVYLSEGVKSFSFWSSALDLLSVHAWGGNMKEMSVLVRRNKGSRIRNLHHISDVFRTSLVHVILLKQDHPYE